MKKQKLGFSVIELMIVVSILGALVVIAVPAYQNYTIRVRVTEGISMLTSGKLAVSKTFASGTPLTSISSLTVAGMSDPFVPTSIVSNMTITGAGIVTVTLDGAQVGGTPFNLVMTPTLASDRKIHWTCTTSLASMYKYVPSNCRSGGS